MDLKYTQTFFGLRIGKKIDLSDRFRLDVFVDLTQFYYSTDDSFDPLTHDSCGNNLSYTWRNLYNIGTSHTDALLSDFTDSPNQFKFSPGLKLGYAF